MRTLTNQTQRRIRSVHRDIINNLPPFERGHLPIPPQPDRNETPTTTSSKPLRPSNNIHTLQETSSQENHHWLPFQTALITHVFGAAHLHHILAWCLWIEIPFECRRGGWSKDPRKQAPLAPHSMQTQVADAPPLPRPPSKLPCCQLTSTSSLNHSSTNFWAPNASSSSTSTTHRPTQLTPYEWSATGRETSPKHQQKPCPTLT